MNIVPLLRQLMVSASVSLSMMEHSLVMGFTTVLLPQLQRDPTITIDENLGSWIASIVGLAAILGTIIGQSLIGRCGRRNANLLSAITMMCGWFIIYLSNSANFILAARFLQGFGLGISNMASAILVGEYTTPRYRGAFLTMTIAGIVTGGLIVHVVGSFLSWYNTALFCLSIAITDSILILMSPESPVFLASRGKYDECRKVFHWLRGFNEEDELEKMITAAIINKTEKQLSKKSETITKKMKLKTRHTFAAMTESEFYKPLTIMLHFFIANAWCTNVMLDVYAVDIYNILIGKDINIFLMLLAMDLSRIISTFSAIVLNAKYKRRPLITIFCSLNVLVLFSIAAYSYVKEQKLPLYDHPAIGGSLICLLTMVSAAGPISSSAIISGEIFPLKYKSVCTLISTLFLCLNISIAMKTQPYMFKSLGAYGAFLVYGAIVTYATFVGLVILPETKDRTLQDIEEECWKPVSDLNSADRIMTDLNEDSKKLMI